MKIAIVGVGAIGGYVGARLAHAGEDVTFIARGANLQALRARGIRLIIGDGSEEAVPQGQRDGGLRRGRAAGRRDPGHEGASGRGGGRRRAQAVRPRYGGRADAERHSLLVLPWPSAARSAGSRVHSVDPTGAIAAAHSRERVIGCVVYPATELLAPGVIKHVEGNRFPVGEPDGSASARVKRVSRVLHPRRPARRRCSSDIRAEIWLKLWGNLTFNPISALSRATLAGICQYPLTRDPGARDDDARRRPSPASSASPSACRSRSASPAPSASGTTRPRCCRTSRRSARSRSTRCSAR